MLGYLWCENSELSVLAMGGEAGVRNPVQTGGGLGFCDHKLPSGPGDALSQEQNSAPSRSWWAESPGKHLGLMGQLSFPKEGFQQAKEQRIPLCGKARNFSRSPSWLGRDSMQDRRAAREKYESFAWLLEDGISDTSSWAGT